MIVENSKITQINAGGAFGDKLRDVMERTKDIQYPGHPGKGIMNWWEASIGTNPHIHRPRKDFPSGFVNCLYERVRSGVIHMGFGTIISSMDERRAARAGHLVGHWHVHLYFPTYHLEREGDNELLIENGRLLALDDPDIRKLAAQYGDADLWLDESWNPAVPGLNMPGDYWEQYAKDPLDWVKTELDICRNDHPRFHGDGRRRRQVLQWRRRTFLDGRLLRPRPCAAEQLLRQGDRAGVINSREGYSAAGSS